ncbi:calcium-binding protein [Fortiea contorta]|uniref:calcium-binding protein n=1 Tax=Fortiea contorta TaxID=1892405 RepID=UPI00034C908D|nr:calcium-binding protein [Fortiea contorta]
MPNYWYGTPGSDYKVGQDPQNIIFISINDGIDIFYGYEGDDTLFGRNGDDFLYGGDDDDLLFGEGDNDYLDGGNGNDTLNGGSGQDHMRGGADNDTYYVDNSGDLVVEFAEQGIDDTVYSSITYTLPAHVENLLLRGTARINGTGNELANNISGNSATNFLFGLDGNDWLFGGGDNDYLDGGNGHDILDGGSGQDEMRGGAGYDTYFVDNSGDLVVEFARPELDTVYSSITYTLPAHVEKLLLTGTARLNGTGNELANEISGNSANNFIYGRAGDDGLFGAGGDDVLFGEQGRDGLEGGSGQDTLFGGQDDDYLIGGDGDDRLYGGNFTLAPDSDTGDDFLDGGNGNDSLLGGQGNDVLIGGNGNDSLTGGTGEDQFRFRPFTDFRASELGIDTITDFSRSEGDKIGLAKGTFTALRSVSGIGFSVSGEFAHVTSDAAAALSGAFIVYNSSNGKLFYNPNGSGSGFATALDAGGHFATLTGNPSLIASDFSLIA